MARSSGAIVTFMMIDKFAPKDMLNRYLVIFEGEAFVFEISGNEVEPIDMPLVLLPKLAEVQQAIVDAFEVHGIFGLQPPRPFDIPRPHFE